MRAKFTAQRKFNSRIEAAGCFPPAITIQQQQKAAKETVENATWTLDKTTMKGDAASVAHCAGEYNKAGGFKLRVSPSDWSSARVDHAPLPSSSSGSSVRAPRPVHKLGAVKELKYIKIKRTSVRPVNCSTAAGGHCALGLGSSLTRLSNPSPLVLQLKATTRSPRTFWPSLTLAGTTPRRSRPRTTFGTLNRS